MTGGRYYEDFTVGDQYRSSLGRTVLESDNVWFTLLTMNTNQMHFNQRFAEKTEFGRPIVVSTLTLAIIVGLSVADTSENAIANLGWDGIKLPHPVFAGDTLWAESEILSLRESQSRPGCGIVGIRTRGINQDGETVIEFSRTFMVLNRGAAAAYDVFPAPKTPWSVVEQE